MSYTVSIPGSQLAESLKDASCYTSRDMYDDATASVVLHVTAKTKKLSVIACDGHGYYERRIPISVQQKVSKSTVLGKFPQLCISTPDASLLAKFISPRILGSVTLEVDDSPKDAKYTVKVTLPDGGSTTIFSRADVGLPDYRAIVEKAEKAKKTLPRLNDVYIPTHEMFRAGKVFPKKNGNAVRMYTSNTQPKGIMALLEYLTPEDDCDIRVIFMLAEPITEAA